MAFNIKKYGSYGTGALGDATNPTAQINSYANVTAYTSTTITIGGPANGSYGTFIAGQEILVHVSATNGTSTDTTYLGDYMTCNITAVAGSVLTVDGDFTAIMPVTNFANYQVQVITIAQFHNLTMTSGNLIPLAYNISTKYGGILAIKCSGTLTMAGGNINLVDRGIPVANIAYRPNTNQENQGTADTNLYSGWENHITARQFFLNSGDGAAFVFAKNFTQTGTASRIGGTQPGVQFTRGNRVGGSTILLVADTISGFDPSIISTVKNSGRGLGRCYIASNTKLRNDEGLYAYDVISDERRAAKVFNLKNFGTGILGDVVNPTAPMNNYAKVTALSSDGKVVSYINKTTNGMAQIGPQSLIMFHVSKQSDNTDMGLLGKFVLAKVISDDGNNLILEASVSSVMPTEKLAKYNCQIVSVAQFNSLTISNNYTGTTAWNDTTKIGGICAIASKGNVNVTGGQINVENKGGGTAYAKEGLAFIGNAQDCDILPLGQGHGSVFILTDTLTTATSSRIGATYSGAELAGRASNGGQGGYVGAGGSASAGGGSGAAGGIGPQSNTGGYGSNGVSDGSSRPGGSQGAHVLIIANTINNFSVNAVSTGGAYSQAGSHTAGGRSQTSGGAGYGGGVPGSCNTGAGGGYNGGGGGCSTSGCSDIQPGGGGASGWCFVYCNNVIGENTTGVIV